MLGSHQIIRVLCQSKWEVRSPWRRTSSAVGQELQPLSADQGPDTWRPAGRCVWGHAGQLCGHHSPGGSPSRENAAFLICLLTVLEGWEQVVHFSRVLE